ncbi:Flp pilus assembly protein CpaB [Pseudarthrobacter raffinosi]|uniref:Flp pilus assembly protein CpaB n=1 Tax=Pseudarthrobacter raffinosi TaxID=2953651 RepID=UPI00208E79C4|nr:MULTISPECIES: Flp pilus assembly protein CpaB [unclassified Pseudarthrobacter]MCO4236042.1 Flp pilus assembly protein CpaB [Pseudarthrobacter sp. MDT3-28]MCO4253301.1 Flp pilus assembly protein CpaB [Pseudarthrobacter sp. MDT3-9]
MKSRLLAGVAAVVLAIIGAVLMFTYAQGADQRAVQELEPVGVLVVKQAIPAGTPVEAFKASIATEQLPGASVAKTSLTTLDSEAGKVAAVDLVPGEQLVAERLVAPEDLKTSGSVNVPAGLQEVSFQLEPQRVVGGRLAPGDHVGVFISMKQGGLEAKTDKETTQLSVHKALVTAVQRAPEAAAAKPAPSESAEPATDPRDSTLPTGSLMLTVAVNDVDAAKIIFASEFASIWLTREPLDAQDNGPRVMQRPEVYK